jgi:hypothetical protein
MFVVASVTHHLACALAAGSLLVIERAHSCRMLASASPIFAASVLLTWQCNVLPLQVKRLCPPRQSRTGRCNGCYTCAESQRRPCPCDETAAGLPPSALHHAPSRWLPSAPPRNKLPCTTLGRARRLPDNSRTPQGSDTQCAACLETGTTNCAPHCASAVSSRAGAVKQPLRSLSSPGCIAPLAARRARPC